MEANEGVIVVLFLMGFIGRFEPVFAWAAAEPAFPGRWLRPLEGGGRSDTACAKNSGVG
jgi:hypothetical protein